MTSSIKQWLVFTAFVLAIGLYVVPSSGQAIRVNGGLSPTYDAVTADTLNTGQGANELYDMNQNVQTTDSPSFDAVTIGPTDGVVLSDDGDGALIMTGAGQGSDESLTWNFDDTANVVVVASNSSVATLFLSGIVMSAPAFYSGSQLTFSDTAPTISSGFGTTPSISSENGTAAFRVNVGTGGTASSGVIGLPTATAGWNCFCTDLTTQSSTVFLCKQTASATTTATIGNFDAAGAAAAWVASNILAVSCFAV